jgi:hypothetical protein
MSDDNLQNNKTVRILVTFKEEISDHDGYCSGNENEYSERTYTKEVQDKELDKDITSYLCYADDVYDPSNRRGQSYYCKMSKEACEADIGPHEVRITVLKAELIN